MREGFVFYRSFSDALEGLPAEQYKTIMVALCKYALNGEEPKSLDPVSNTIFTLIKPQIDANSRRYENGCKGGRPKKETENNPINNQTETKQKPNRNQTKTSPEPKDKDKDKVKEKVNIKDPVLEKAIEDYTAHRKKIKSPLTDRALDLALKKLEEYAPGDTPLKVKIINESIMNGWKGLYPPKEKAAGTYRDDDLDGKLIAGIQSRNRTAPVVEDWGRYFETG